VSARRVGMGEDARAEGCTPAIPARRPQEVSRTRDGKRVRLALPAGDRRDATTHSIVFILRNSVAAKE